MTGVPPASSAARACPLNQRVWNSIEPRAVTFHGSPGRSSTANRVAGPGPERYRIAIFAQTSLLKFFQIDQRFFRENRSPVLFFTQENPS